jgi:hypothetical protein
LDWLIGCSHFRLAALIREYAPSVRFSSRSLFYLLERHFCLSLCAVQSTIFERVGNQFHLVGNPSRTEIFDEIDQIRPRYKGLVDQVLKSNSNLINMRFSFNQIAWGRGDERHIPYINLETNALMKALISGRDLSVISMLLNHGAYDLSTYADETEPRELVDTNTFLKTRWTCPWVDILRFFKSFNSTNVLRVHNERADRTLFFEAIFKLGTFLELKSCPALILFRADLLEYESSAITDCWKEKYASVLDSLFDAINQPVDDNELQRLCFGAALVLLLNGESFERLPLKTQTTKGVHADRLGLIEHYYTKFLEKLFAVIDRNPTASSYEWQQDLEAPFARNIRVPMLSRSGFLPISDMRGLNFGIGWVCSGVKQKILQIGLMICFQKLSAPGGI